MCLDSVTKRYEPNDDMIVGYKVFRVGYRGGLTDKFQWIPRIIGRCYSAKKETLNRYSREDKYISGFHIFKSRAGAEKLFRLHDYHNADNAIYEVHGWGIIVEGRQFGSQNYVCNHMRIIKRVDE